MIELEPFLKKYNISKEEFEKTTLKWTDLKDIYDDYTRYKDLLLQPAKYLSESLHSIPDVHSVRFRIKNSEHLIEKIIRKRIDDPKRTINIENYKTEITDLIGLRALHLYKSDWDKIHDEIIGLWNTAETPTAYYRLGDFPSIIEEFKKKGCITKEHKYGYRSVHYIVKTKPNINEIFAEIQVRTIFEEGWSEIDHRVRYPYHMTDPIFNSYLSIFNSLAGTADSMGTYIMTLKASLTKMENESQQKLQKLKTIIAGLKDEIADLKEQQKNSTAIDPKCLDDLDERISQIDIDNYSQIIEPVNINLNNIFPGAYTVDISNWDTSKFLKNNPLFNDDGSIKFDKDE